MFSCKHREPRITAVAAMRKSNVLDHGPPGIHLGHWDYPPHLKDLRYLASAATYKLPGACTTEENDRVLGAYSKEFPSPTRLYNLDVESTLQLVIQGTPKKPAYQRAATIGATVLLCGRRFYLAPAHILSCQGKIPPETTPEADPGLEDSDCDLDGFDYDNMGPPNAQEAEYTSQYSLSLNSSDTEEDLYLNEESSSSDVKSDYISSRREADEPDKNILAPCDNAEVDPEGVKPSLALYTFCAEVELSSLKSDDFDYCLIEVDETNYLPDLPDFSRENIGQLDSGSVDVVAATASGNILTGVLSSRLSCIRAPNATRYIDVFFAHFEGSLKPGDSGSIVRDAASGVIYGHISAGDTSSKTALIIPAVDVLDDMMARSARIETSSAEYSQQQCAFITKRSLSPTTMADSSSITASLLTVITAAVQSTNALRATITRFKDRDKTLARLQSELCDLSTILDSLEHVVDTKESILLLLKGPIERCTHICREFEQSVDAFARESKTGFRDWTKMEFMRGDIHEFMDTISGYKSTISVGLGTFTIHNAKVSQGALHDYNEMIQDTIYNLEVHLQRVDERMARLTTDTATFSNSTIDLKDEKEVTNQCLRICEDAIHYIESLANRESSILCQEPQDIGEDNKFEAQILTRQVLNENQDSLATIIGQLRSRLETLVLKNDPDNESERSRLLSDINVSKQCLEVCKVASEVSNRKEYRDGEAVADGNSDQVVTTLGDIFDVKKAFLTDSSAQLVGSMTEEALQDLTEKRYRNRFGALTHSKDFDVRGTRLHSARETQT
ncbi:hypothetical protein N7504_007429 [Penicillium tannophilum]|nr:hypothetical protein N7504_007429 [Penicillium tannophilum]